MFTASISQFDGRLVNQQRRINDCGFRLFDSSEDSVGIIQFQNNLQISMIICFFDRKVSAFFFSSILLLHINLHLSRSSFAGRLIAWLVKSIKNEPAVFWLVGLLQISLDEKIPRHCQLFSWVKTINMKEKWDANVFILFIYFFFVKVLLDGSWWLKRLDTSFLLARISRFLVLSVTDWV